jgi:hypothetical protein
MGHADARVHNYNEGGWAHRIRRLITGQRARSAPPVVNCQSRREQRRLFVEAHDTSLDGSPGNMSVYVAMAILSICGHFA